MSSRGGREEAEHRRGHHLHHVLQLLCLPLPAHLECSPCVRIEPVQNGTVKLTPDLTTRTRPRARRTSPAARASRSLAPRTPRCACACRSPRVWSRKATRFRVRSHQRARTYCKSAILGRTWRLRMTSAPSSPHSHAQTSAGCSDGLAGMYEAPTPGDFSQCTGNEQICVLICLLSSTCSDEPARAQIQTSADKRKLSRVGEHQYEQTTSHVSRQVQTRDARSVPAEPATTSVPLSRQ
jgi:hypothetical protein